MAKKDTAKLIALSFDPGARTETFEDGQGPPPIDLKLYKVYRVSESAIEKVIFGPKPEYQTLDPNSVEYRKVRKAAGF